ncbi:MAG: glycosyltransferase family 4 protein [Solirubrobacteraceae bacterium]
MRVLVLSNLYPPVVRGGYEVECSAVVERLGAHHELLVLTSDLEAASQAARDGVRRELRFLPDDWRGAGRAPLAAVRAAAVARRALAWRPDIAYVWNHSSTPQAALRVLADAGTPLAFRPCSHALGSLFVGDQFMRELLPAKRKPPRTAWAGLCRAVNATPALRLDPQAPLRAAIAWNAEFMRAAVQPPPFVEPVLERVVHSVPRHGAVFEAVERAPGPQPEIAFLGRVTPFKGLEIAIRALACLRDRHAIAASLVVIGPEDPGHGAEMRRLAAELGLEQAVRWCGQRTPQQAAASLARAHALIVPSVWLEPFPLVTIEGAFARVPLVAANIGGIGEGMQDEQHALLYEPSDPDAAAAALARTLNEPVQTAARVQRAYERAQDFTLERYLREQERFVADAAAALGVRAG